MQGLDAILDLGDALTRNNDSIIDVLHDLLLFHELLRLDLSLVMAHNVFELALCGGSEVSFNLLELQCQSSFSSVDFICIFGRNSLVI